MEPTLLEAIRAGAKDRVAEMLEARPELANSRDSSGVSAVCQAMYQGRPEIAHEFVSHGAVLDIFDASATGNLPRVRELVKRDPSLVNTFSPDGFPPLGLAAYFGHEDVVEFLLDHRADVEAAARNPMQVRPIHAATARRSVPIVRMLLERGADPNSQQQMGYTAMDAAIQHGDHEIIGLLLAHGATKPSSPTEP